MFSTRRFPLSFVLCLTLALAMFTGCELFNGDEDDDDRDRVGDRGDDRIGRVDTTTGVPREAERVKEGRGSLSYAAEDDGTIYLFDATDERVMHTQRVRKGQRYTIAPERDVASLDGRAVYERNLGADHVHHFYFQRAR